MKSGLFFFIFLLLVQISIAQRYYGIANSNYDEFYQLQHSYIKKVYYDTLISDLTKAGPFDQLLNSFSIRNVLMSLSVQFGRSGALALIKKIGYPSDKVIFIQNLYTERSRVDIYFSSEKNIPLWPSLLTRFTNEQNDALRIYNYELTYLK